MRAVTVKEFFHLPEWPSKLGDIGIEIEMEGTGMEYPTGPVANIWNAKADHSMKGPGLEYYLASPVPRDQVKGAIKDLKDYWKLVGAKPKPTNCDAVHVHMNCRDLTLDQTMCFILLLVMLEDILVKWCGEEREGNLFCMRARDAENFLTVLRSVLIAGKFTGLSMEYLKYANINIAPLGHFGSVEIRCMQTPKDITMVTTWVNILCCIYDAALKLGNIRDVPDILGNYYADDLMLHIFGDLSVTLMCDGIDQLLMAGQERVREVVYSAHIYSQREKNKTLIAPKKKKRVATKPEALSIDVSSDWGSQPSSLGIFSAGVVIDEDYEAQQPSAPVGVIAPVLTDEPVNANLYFSKLGVPPQQVKKFLTDITVPGLYIYQFPDGTKIKTTYQFNSLGIAQAWYHALKTAQAASVTPTAQG